MKRRDFVKAAVAGAALMQAAAGSALQFYPKASDKKWAVLFGSRYGSTRDASIWISEGMGAIASVFDVREEPDLGSFDYLVIGSGIYGGKVLPLLEQYLQKHGEAIGKKVKGVFAVCGQGEGGAKEYVPMITSLCKAQSPEAKSFPGRMTRSLFEPDVYKRMEDFYKGRNQPFEDNDRLSRVDCLAFGKGILEACQKRPG